MTETSIIRYRTKPEFAAENQRLIEAVITELADRRPAGLHYTVYRSDDGVSFTHIVSGDGAALTKLPAFQEFQRNIADRWDGGPERTIVSPVGAYLP